MDERFRGVFYVIRSYIGTTLTSAHAEGSGGGHPLASSPRLRLGHNCPFQGGCGADIFCGMHKVQQKPRSQAVKALKLCGWLCELRCYEFKRK